MTKRDYVKFAKMIREERIAAKFALILRFQELIANILECDNKRFNRQRFYRACEPKE